MGSGNYKGEYHAPGHKATTIRGSFTSDDSVGVKDGLSARRDLDSKSLHDVSMNNEVSKSGNPRSCIEPRGSKSVSEKGHTFNMC